MKQAKATAFETLRNGMLRTLEAYLILRTLAVTRRIIVRMKAISTTPIITVSRCADIMRTKTDATPPSHRLSRVLCHFKIDQMKTGISAVNKARGATAHRRLVTNRGARLKTAAT